MMSLACRIAVSTALVFAAAGAASAEPIRITSGAFAMPGAGGASASITLGGEGFTFNASTSPSEAFISPREQCGVPECRSGTVVNLQTRAGGLALRNGTATYDGTTYEHVGGLGSLDAGLTMSWDGSLVIPDGFTGGSLMAPFMFSGIFSYWTGSAFQSVDLVGAGTATIAFAPYGGGAIFPGALTVQGLRFDFEPAATPEPASLLLLGTGLAGLAAARRRRA